ncbi:MAG: TolC family protein [Bacteroidales bacterium]|nr:TolC family protein [Bacteroidales bacterium]
MKISACIKVFLTLVATCFWLTGNSQQYPDSLIKYLGIAAKNNPLVLQKFSEYQASLQKIPQVGTLPDPELSLGVFLQPMELINGNQVADLRLMQMFPWFGVLKSARDEMSLMAKAKFELFRDAKIQLYYDIQRTWYELYKLRKNISISEKNVEILKIIERLALVRFKSAPTENEGTASAKVPVSSSPAQNTSTAASGMQTMSADQNNSASSISGQTSSSMQSSSMGQASGSIGLSEIYTIQIEEGDLENNIALLKNRQSTVTAQFNSYLNRPVSSPVYIPDTITIDSLDFSLIAVSDSMLANNPMLDMLDFEMQSIDARKKMVTRMGYPMVGIGLNYSLIDKSHSGMAEPSMNGKDMMMPMLTVTLPVYRRKYNAMKTEADLLKDASSRNYQFISNSLQTEYYQAIQLYQDASRRVKLYDNQYTLASKSFDLMLKNFTVASAGLTDVLRIRQQTLDYEFKQSEAMADFNIAVAWLKKLGNMEIGIIR